MSREIKFDYVYKHKKNGSIGRLLLNLNSDLETNAQSLTVRTLRKEYDLIAKRQYTGLKDSKGVEIYEGDIVKIMFDESETDTSNHEIMYYADTGYPAFDLKPHIDFDMTNGLALTIPGEYISIEVIGNIYENKELLNV